MQASEMVNNCRIKFCSHVLFYDLPRKPVAAEYSNLLEGRRSSAGSRWGRSQMGRKKVPEKGLNPLNHQRKNRSFGGVETWQRKCCVCRFMKNVPKFEWVCRKCFWWNSMSKINKKIYCFHFHATKKMVSKMRALAVLISKNLSIDR